MTPTDPYLCIVRQLTGTLNAHSFTVCTTVCTTDYYTPTGSFVSILLQYPNMIFILALFDSLELTGLTFQLDGLSSLNERLHL